MPEDILIGLLESFGYPVMLQGSLGDDEDYPDTFFTFWNNISFENTFYDNENHSEISDFDVNVYSNDAEVVYSVLRSAKNLLKENGFTIADSGHSTASDVETHTGRGINVLYSNL